MSFTITSILKEDHILVISTGSVEGKEDLFKHAELVYNEISRYDKKNRVIIDNTETTFPSNMFHYYEQVQFFSANLPDEIRSWKIALVMKPEFQEFGKFWETISVNRGFNYYSFTSLDEALRWLRS